MTAAKLLPELAFRTEECKALGDAGNKRNFK